MPTLAGTVRQQINETKKQWSVDWIELEQLKTSGVLAPSQIVAIDEDNGDSPDSVEISLMAGSEALTAELVGASGIISVYNKIAETRWSEEGPQAAPAAGRALDIEEE